MQTVIEICLPKQKMTLFDFSPALSRKMNLRWVEVNSKCGFKPKQKGADCQPP
jgi:hypothetical protein